MSSNLQPDCVLRWSGDAEGSTLRLTLGCLLGLELRRVGSGKRMTFGLRGEAELSAWMGAHARVCWVECPEPWRAEAVLI
ncbi:GIY-YIG nuclease family protein [Actinopolymorpha alba]|uniref:GIY-YIG nuclease family protein n=1 Tax=Actinopolymorpha alba TaxID=533267 RepID=UPI003B502F34